MGQKAVPPFWYFPGPTCAKNGLPLPVLKFPYSVLGPGFQDLQIVRVLRRPALRCVPLVLKPQRRPSRAKQQVWSTTADSVAGFRLNLWGFREYVFGELAEAEGPSEVSNKCTGQSVLSVVICPPRQEPVERLLQIGGTGDVDKGRGGAGPLQALDDA